MLRTTAIGAFGMAALARHVHEQPQFLPTVRRVRLGRLTEIQTDMRGGGANHARGRICNPFASFFGRDTERPVVRRGYELRDVSDKKRHDLALVSRPIGRYY